MKNKEGIEMKRIWVGCIMVVTFSLAEEYTQADRIFDMQKMAQAMQDMQALHCELYL